MSNLEKYRNNVNFPIVNLEMDEPLSLMRRSGLALSEHPLSTLAKVDPDGARGIMHELVHVEHRKVDLGFAALTVDLRKAEIAADVAKTGHLCSTLLGAMQTNPGHGDYSVCETKFFIPVKTIKVKIRR